MHDIGVYRAWFRGSGDQGGWERVGERPYATVSSAVRGGALTVLSQASLERPGTQVEVVRLDADGGEKVLATIGSHAEQPSLTARPRLVLAGERGFRVPCCCRAAIRRATVRCRCCWTRTAVRTASGWSPRTTPI